MHVRSLLACVLAGAVAGAAALAPAQDQPPILKPKPKAPSTATLLVLCDLACNWNLDGEAQDRIEAGASVKAKVAFGEHLVIATTDDGLDKIQQLTTVKAAGQKVVNLRLQPIRDNRLKAAQDARYQADQQQRDGAVQKARDRAARDEAARGDHLNTQATTPPAGPQGATWTAHPGSYTLDFGPANACRWRLSITDPVVTLEFDGRGQAKNGSVRYVYNEAWLREPGKNCVSDVPPNSANLLPMSAANVQGSTVWAEFDANLRGGTAKPGAIAHFRGQFDSRSGKISGELRLIRTDLPPAAAAWSWSIPLQITFSQDGR